MGAQVVYLEDFDSQRFEIVRKLGAGGFGVVYQVFDNERNSTVALKTLLNGDSESLFHFKNEFRSIADIVHPNLVTLYELISDKDRLFFTMELVEGISFLDYVRGNKFQRSGQTTSSPTIIKSVEIKERITVNDAITLKVDPNNPLTPNITFEGLCDIVKLRAALKQLAEGVCAIHQTGKLHRDLKPSNVLVTDEGRVVILDFGLVTELSLQRSERVKEVIGTPDYMAPEHARGMPLTEASDWYSVGVMLYQALTGRLPFDNTFGNVLKEKQLYEPPPPSEFVPEIPEDLNSLCQDLLRLDPANRPNGIEILDRLGALPANFVDSSFVSSGLMRVKRLVGRDEQLEALNQACNEAQSGRSMIVYVHGKAGLGKSALVRCFLEYRQMGFPDMVVLTGRCFEQESVPYKALDGCIDSLSRYLKQLPRVEREEILPVDLPALARLFPVLKQFKPSQGKVTGVLEIPDPQELRRRAVSALRELLAQIAQRRPLVIFIDDLQWGDVDSASVLSELLFNTNPPRLLFIACYRSEEADSSTFLQSFLPLRHPYGANAEIREITINELSPDESLTLAEELLGKDSQISMPRVNAMVRESGGNPYFIDEAIRYLQFENELAEHVKSEMAVCALTLEGVIMERIAYLPENARNLLSVVAVAGRPLDRKIASAVAELDDEEQNALAQLRASHLIRIRQRKDQNEIETYNNKIRDTMLNSFTRVTRQRWHARLAEALEDMTINDPEILAYHFQESGNREQAINYTMMAAERATDALAFDRAAQLYRKALNMMTGQDHPSASRYFNPTLVYELLCKLAEALAYAGRSYDSARTYLEAADAAEPKEALLLRRNASEQLFRSGHFEEGLKLVRALLTDLGVKIVDNNFQILSSYVYHQLRLRLRGYKFQERREADIPSDEILFVDTYYSIALALGYTDVIRGAEIQTRHLLAALEVGEPYRVARAIAFEAAYISTAGSSSLTRTKSLIVMATKIAERINQPHAIGITTHIAGQTAFLVGRWKKAYELCERGTRVLREQCQGVAFEIDVGAMFALRSLYFLGRLADMAAGYNTAYKAAQERGNLYSTTGFRIRIGFIVSLAADDAERARTETRQAIEQWARPGFDMQHYYAMFAEAEIALYQGHYQQAWQIIEERWPLLERSQLMRVQYVRVEAWHVRARVALALAAHSNVAEPFIKQAEKDARSIEGEKLDWANPLALTIRAGVAVLRAEKDRARKLLERAATGFDSVDMALYAAATRRRLGELTGGGDGDRMVKISQQWMNAQQIKRPAKLTAMLLPGNW